MDASYAVNPNMKSHTGSVMSHGYGIIYTQLSLPKLVMMSLVEVEVAGVCGYSLQN